MCVRALFTISILCVFTSDSCQLFGEELDDFVFEVDESANNDSLDPSAETRDTVDGLAQLVGVVVRTTRRGQIGSTETAQQQRQKQIQYLK